MSEQTGAKIKEARTAAGMTQKELAEAIDGLSASDISKAERGLMELTDEQLEAIAKATGAESLLSEANEEAPAAPEASESKAADNNPMASVMGMVGSVMNDDAKREKAANTVMGMVGDVMRDDASREKAANAVMGVVGDAMRDDEGREKAANTVMGVVNNVIGSEEADGGEE